MKCLRKEEKKFDPHCDLVTSWTNSKLVILAFAYLNIYTKENVLKIGDEARQMIDSKHGLVLNLFMFQKDREALIVEKTTCE